MDGHLIVTGAGGAERVTAILKARIHVECEACREEARRASEARFAGESIADAKVAPPLGPEAREGLFRSNFEQAQGEDVDATGLTEAEQELVEELSARDREVRRHEEAHARVGGEYAGQPSYSYQAGPDGKRYAIGGEVSIDVAPVPDDPEATIAKMEVVKQAALAPAEPSAADRRVAAIADAQRLQAMADLTAKRLEERFSTFELPTQTPANRDLAGMAQILSNGPETEPGQDLALAA